MIQEAGDYLQGQLPDHPNHPKGRNPYAHVAICIKALENDTGSWWLFAGLAVQLCSALFSLVHSSYADNLKFIKK